MTMSNKTSMYDPSEYYSQRLIQCLDDLRFNIAEYFVLNYMCDIGTHQLEEDLIRITLKRTPKLFKKPTKDETQKAIHHLLQEGHLIKIDAYHLETITRLLDMCKIINRGFIPLIGEIDVTPRGFSVYRYWQETVFKRSYITPYDSVAIHDDSDTIIRACASTPEHLCHDMENSISMKRYKYDIDKIEYCGQWCRRWWKIIPIGYSCPIEIQTENIITPVQTISCGVPVVPVQKVSSDLKTPDSEPDSEVKSEK